MWEWIDKETTQNLNTKKAAGISGCLGQRYLTVVG